MTIVAPDELHRLIKLAIDSGEATSVEHAQRIFAGYRLGVSVGKEISSSATHQAALITLIKLASRVFHGGIDIVMPTGAVIPSLLPGIGDLEKAIAAAGVQRVEAIDPDLPCVHIGTTSAARAGHFAVRCVFSGWRAGIVPVACPPPFEFESEFTLSGALSAAFAVNEAFLYVRQDTAEAGHREVGLSLWKPDALEDWGTAENDGPQLAYLPSKLWLIGLGHLGQAYLWGLALLPYARPQDLELVLQDCDVISQSTVSTSVLSDRALIGLRKTRAMAAIMEGRGFNTSIVERHFDKEFRARPDDPAIGLCGVDNTTARRALAEARFKFIVEAGLGSGAKDFRAIRIHTFPATKDPRDLWYPSSEKAIDVSAPAYGDLKARGLDQCGVTLLAGKAVGAPFVGMAAGIMCLSEILRLLHGGSIYTVHELDLKAPARRSSIPRKSPLQAFNPGFTAAVPSQRT